MFGLGKYTCREMLNPVPYSFQAFNSLIRSFTGSSNLYFQVPIAKVDADVDFFQTNVEPIDQVKSNLS